MRRTCRYEPCSKEFTPNHPRQEFCEPTCWSRSLLDWRGDPVGSCSSCGNAENRRLLSCRSCGSRYSGRPCPVCRARFRPKTGSQRFCSLACRAVVYPVCEVVERSCIVCGGGFKPRRSSRKTCSVACQQAYRRSRSRERIGERDPFLGMLLGDPCVYCGKTATGFDHITPKVEGGSDLWPNLAPCCGRCNSSKSATPLLFFLRRRPLGVRA